MSDMQVVPELGVGLAFQPALRSFIESNSNLFDFLEVVPDILWTDLGPDKPQRYVEDLSGTGFLKKMRERLPVIPHSIGLSIGSAHRFDLDHIAQIARWHDWLQFPWHSDHLAYNLVEHEPLEMNVGVTLPLPYDKETLELLVPRILEVQSRIPVPFLLENNVYFFDFVEQEFDEAAFLNRLCELSGCYLLLDLHNLYTNCRNHGTDPYAFLNALDLRRVLEIHLAGGMEYEGYYLDAHSGTTPAPVWELLEWTLPRCPNLGGIVFELLGSWFVEVGDERLTDEIRRMKTMWRQRKQMQEREAA
ncbi:MAG: DUF692 domain-containing protein [Pyrinomonadaceae bacterium]